MDSDDPAVFFDENCLRLYRIKFDGDVTFPYHASQLLHAGGQQTMALFIQHGAMRDADHYFCSIAKLMLEQNHRPFKDILVIAPNFEYKRDYKVYPYDAFWNSTKVSVFIYYLLIMLSMQFLRLSGVENTQSLGGIGVMVHNRIRNVVVIRKIVVISKLLVVSTY